MYYIVQPYASGPDRTRHATIVSIHESVDVDYVALDAIANRLNSFGLFADVLELLVVDENR